MKELVDVEALTDAEALTHPEDLIVIYYIYQYCY